MSTAKVSFYRMRFQKKITINCLVYDTEVSKHVAIITKQIMKKLTHVILIKFLTLIINLMYTLKSSDVCYFQYNLLLQ